MSQLKDLVTEDIVINALKPLSEKQFAALKSAIIRDGKILDPILWCRTDEHVEIVVDGHHRLEVYDELVDSGSHIDEPSTQEVVTLRGKPLSDVVAWVKEHQACRRNDETLFEIYCVGTQYQTKTSTELAATTGMTPQQVRHAGKVASNIDAAEELEPGSRQAILDSDIPPCNIRDAKPEQLTKSSLSARSGATKDPKPPADKSGIQAFEPITKQIAVIQRAVGILARSINEIIQEDTTTTWSEACEKYVSEIGQDIELVSTQVQEWIKSKL